MGSDGDKFEERARHFDELMHRLARWELRWFLVTMAVGIPVAIVLVVFDL